MGAIEIPLTQGKVALIDEEDLHLVAPYKWYAWKARNTFYAMTNVYLGGQHSTPGMHRIILGLTKGQMGDHRDRNGLNNTRGNLRACSNSQNMANKTAYKNNKSGYKGVSWHPALNRWRAKIMINCRQVSLGCFTDPWDAAQAYNSVALDHFGNFAVLNERKL